MSQTINSFINNILSNVRCLSDFIWNARTTEVIAHSNDQGEVFPKRHWGGNPPNFLDVFKPNLRF